jgi:hypothetical protein
MWKLKYKIKTDIGEIPFSGRYVKKIKPCSPWGGGDRLCGQHSSSYEVLNF